MGDHSTPKKKTKKSAIELREVQDTVSRLASGKGVLAVSIFTSDGDVVTQQITAAGSARMAASNNSKSSPTTNSAVPPADGSGGGDDGADNAKDKTTGAAAKNNNNSSRAGSGVSGNPKLLTKMMR